MIRALANAKFVKCLKIQYLFIALYYRQLSAYIKMKNFKIITSFVNPEGQKFRANKTYINPMIYILIFVESCL